MKQFKLATKNCVGKVNHTPLRKCSHYKAHHDIGIYTAHFTHDAIVDVGFNHLENSMSYKGRIVKLSNGKTDMLDYICVEDEGTHLGVIPAEGCDLLHYRSIPINGENRWQVGVARDDDQLIHEVYDRISWYISNTNTEAYQAIIGSSVFRDQAQEILAKLYNLLVWKEEQDKEAVDAYHEGFNGVFADIYGSDSYDPYDDLYGSYDDLYGPEYTYDDIINAVDDFGYVESLVGRIAFIEIPFGVPEATEGGEYIIVQQSHDSLYGIQCGTAMQGTRLTRIKITGEPCAKVLDSYDDTSFILDFIDRLQCMTTEDYPEQACDAADSTSTMLLRMIERKYGIMVRYVEDGPEFGIPGDEFSSIDLGGTLSGRFPGGCNGVQA